ncbi:MAG TPA: polysaccharide deacetylase family protein [Candidatus Sulfopaludibacter sp.]|jgi:peptidoglycan/xylan/chitin deacetylase (PgdA/CDA1 family)/tetratricopeptide (TPR) repeat protein|nr:polysaccharide deacetylase family protein [Candidatus Sulfopaludibacter sp.]
MTLKTKYLAAGVVTVTIACLLLLIQPLRRMAFRQDPALAASLQSVTDNYRKIIILVDGSEELDGATRARAIAAGRILFWTNHRTIDELAGRFTTEYQQRKTDGIRQLLEYLTDDKALHDADKLAFLDLIDQLTAVPPASSKRTSLVDSLHKASDNLQAIQLSYREEVSRIFSQFATRGATGTREKWDAYVASLRKTTSRERILLEMGDVLPEEPHGEMRGGGSEIFGNEFQPKTVALTFDDGPHPRYTEQVLALLRKYSIKATFFELGVNLGTVQDGKATLSRTGEVAHKVLDAGHVIANHSYSHAVLPKLDTADQASEIDRTNLLLEKVAGFHPDLFRAPYGARNKEILDRVQSDGLKSIMWTIDSLDWADPVPESIAMRVLHEINQRHKGIILFHDIHKQSVMALSPVIEELQRQEYTFLAPEKGQFVKAVLPQAPTRSEDTAEAAPTAGGAAAKNSYYRESWAVIVGINDYQNWPKLRYAVNDANGVEEVLVSKFGFKKENIRKLTNGEATRQRIMEVLGDEFTDGRKVQREDRVFFFFAGHGATRTFEDGRQIGFIIPSDADRANYYSTAISMTALREASDLIPAKHIYFVMDSCYSGLALTRSAGTFARDHTYLEEVTRRQSRQILTAGGADEQVADDGPTGHSVFTWALLQGLQGQADLDGNGVITASELGAYVSPIVSSFAKQTPTVGNLVGSEGGEFLFELQPEALTSLTRQMDGQGVHLNDQLSHLQSEIAAKQAELLKIQQSIQSESARLTLITRSAPPPARTKTKAQQAYDLDRQGQLLYREKKYDEALQKFKGAVELQPNDAVLLNNLGFLYYVMGRYDDAVNYLQKTLTADPKRKEAHGNIADALMKLGRRDEARQHYQQYVALFPNSPRAPEVKKLLETL